MFDEWRATVVGDANERFVSVPGRPAAFADADGLTYVSNFADPRSHREDVAAVELRGLYATATIDVTGQCLDGDGGVTDVTVDAGDRWVGTVSPDRGRRGGTHPRNRQRNRREPVRPLIPFCGFR